MSNELFAVKTRRDSLFFVERKMENAGADALTDDEALDLFCDMLDVRPDEFNERFPIEDAEEVDPEGINKAEYYQRFKQNRGPLWEGYQRY